MVTISNKNRYIHLVCAFLMLAAGLLFIELISTQVFCLTRATCRCIVCQLFFFEFIFVVKEL